MAELIETTSLDKSLLYVRANGVLALTHGEQITIRSPLGRDMAVTKHVMAFQQMLEATFLPRSSEDIASLMGLPQDATTNLLRLLIDRGILKEHYSALHTQSPNTSLPFERLCLGVCGSINCLGTPALLTRLKTVHNLKVEVVMTSGARRFLNTNAIESLGFRVWHEPYSITDDIHVPHAWLADSCGMILIAPASATTIQRLAMGACSDLLSLVVACSRSPIVIAPAMHPGMWRFGPVRKNIEILKDAGMYILEPVTGFSVSASEMQHGACAATSENILELLPWLAKRAGRSTDTALVSMDSMQG